MIPSEPKPVPSGSQPKGNFEIILKDLDTGRVFVAKTTELSFSQNWKVPAPGPIEAMVKAECEVVSTVVAFNGKFDLIKIEKRKR